jgi:hypothetical protein
MAAPDGLISIFEMDAHRYEDEIREAKLRGLLKRIASGGWGVDDVYSLTAAGRELMGMRPTLLQDLVLRAKRMFGN